MPTYEYRCDACGHRLEAVQRFSDDPLTTCPECGGALRRVFHPVGVVLKGSGFYATDNRSKRALKPGEKGGDKARSDRDRGESGGERGGSRGDQGGSGEGKGGSGGSGEGKGGSGGERGESKSSSSSSEPAPKSSSAGSDS